MSSRPISTSQPAFAMVLGSSSFFLFVVMAHPADWARPGRARKEAGPQYSAVSAWGVKRNFGLTARRGIDRAARPWAMSATEKGLKREKRLAREQAQNPLEEWRRRGQWLARNSELGIRRKHGALRLGLRGGRPAAWPRRLHRCRPDAAGHLADRRDAAGARSLEYAGYYHEAARCRRLWHRLPDDQHTG